LRSRGAQPGPGGVGPALARGEADIGYQKGEATADTTTTATESLSDFAKAVSVGFLGGPLSWGSYTLTGNTPLGHIGYTLADLFGLTPSARNERAWNDIPPELRGIAPGDYSYDGGGLAPGSDPGLAGNTGEASSESPGLY
jgi:hypothetical protein